VLWPLAGALDEPAGLSCRPPASIPISSNARKLATAWLNAVGLAFAPNFAAQFKQSVLVMSRMSLPLTRKRA